MAEGKNNLVVEREKKLFTMSRVFDATREEVWEAYTNPEMVKKWWGQRSSNTIIDKMEVKEGGAWRYIQRDPDGSEHAFSGEYKEVKAPERLSYSFIFEPMPDKVCVDSLEFEELEDGKTRLNAVTTFDSVEDLDGMLQTGMESGAVESWDQLEELLSER